MGDVGGRQVDEGATIPVATELGPCVELELRGRRVHLEGTGSLEVPVRPGAEAALVVRVKNETDRPASVELRDLPPWLRASEPAVVVAPGKTADLRATLSDPATARRVCGGVVVGGTLVVRAEDDLRALRVELILAPEAARGRRRRKLALATLAAVVLGAYLSFVGYLRAARVEALAAHAVTVQGRVTRLTPSNHNQMYYEYEAEGAVYERNDFARGERIGDPVEVSYLPGDPAVSVRGRAYDTYAMPGYLVVPFLALMFATIAFVVTAIVPSRREVDAS